MKIIVLSPFVYYPGVPNGGGALCWGQLEGLASQHELHFLSFTQAGSGEYEVAKPHLESRCKSVTTVAQDLGRTQVLRSKLALLTRLQPIVASLCASAEMTATLKKLIAKVKPDAVLIQFPQMAQYVDACQGVATVMDVHDAYSVSGYRRFKVAGRPPQKALAFLLWLSWIRYEAHWYPQFSVTAALTQQDRLGLEIFSPGLSAVVSPAAVSVPERRWSGAGQKTIAFIGSFAHEPNAEGVLYFIQAIFPLVRQQLPDLVLLIAGKGVPSNLLALAGPNIKFVGVVPDAGEFLGAAGVVAIPLLSGGGIKIKTLEAMASSCPIVTTSIGAEETGAQSGTHLVVADSTAEFAHAVLRVLQDSTLALQLGSNAREMVQAQFSWAAKWRSLHSLIGLAVERNALKLNNVHKVKS